MEPDAPIARRLVALLSADIAGYSRLMADDDVGTVRTLGEYHQEIRSLAERYQGRVVDAPGDNVLVEFPSALDATECAIEIQKRLTDRNASRPPARHMRLRIGVHLGDVMVKGERIYGDGVNIAARLESCAEPGGICVSGTVYELVRGKLSVGVDDLGEHAFKNIPHPVRVYRLRPEGAAPARPPEAAPPGQDALRALAARRDIAVFVVPATWVLYVAIVLEILFMISPLGIYYYTAYGPSLNLLHRSPWTAWLTQFFLPHFSETTSPALNAVHPASFVLIALGAALFGVGFVQVYSAKLRRRGPVTSGLYGLLRHPQYVALAILGLGTLLVWPRFLVLLMYVTMLFLYALLARWEERRCLEQFGASYGAYLARTAAARRLRGAASAGRPGGRSRGARLLATYVGAVGASVGLGMVLREYSLRRVAGFYLEHAAVLSPARLSEEQLRGAWAVAGGPELYEQLAAAGRPVQLLAYVVPTGWELPDLPLPRPEKPRGGHYTPADYDAGRFRVLFTTARTHDPDARARQIVARAYGRDPIAVVRIDLARGVILEREQPPPHVHWGDIPTPLF